MKELIIMAVFRVERTHNYTVMSNYHLRDKNLSLKAKGLLSQMLSLPEDWDYTLSGLARINAEGTDAIRAAIVELEKAGYVQRRQTTDKTGKFCSNEYVIREYPVSNEPPSLAQSLSENPTTEKSSTVFTSTENPTQLNKELRNKENKILTPQSTDSFPFPSAPSVATAAQPSETKERKRTKRKRVSKDEMDTYREIIRENIGYDSFVQERPYDAGQLDEMVELMVETVCSNKETIRVAGSDFPQAVVKSRLLKLDKENIRFVFNCLKENTTKVRNMKQYLLTVLYNAPATMENHYASQVNYDLYGKEIGASM
jgi:hypothetical protein